MARAADHRALVPVVERLVEQRSGEAAASVAALRAEHPDASPDDLADLLIRRAVRELTVSGAMTGGAAASPLAGSAVAAIGADSIYGVGRLSELVVALGLVYGHGDATTGERASWVLGALGVSEATAMGVTGLAAKVGARGGARLVAKLPAAGTGAAAAGAGAAAAAGRATASRAAGTAGRRALARAGAGRGPWSLAALVPYGIGAGVGAAGNALLARSVGQAAKQWFRDHPPATPAPPPWTGGGRAEPLGDDIVDAVVVEETLLEDVVIEDAVIEDAVIEDTAAGADVVDADVVDADVVDPRR